jgi:hypothetical protein
MSISHVPAQPDHVIVPRVALSVDQTAAALGTSRTFVENIIRGRDCRGRAVPVLNAKRVGRRVFVEAAELERWLRDAPPARQIQAA